VPDPRERAAEVERLVFRPETMERRYYRFRAAPYYGGIATADAVGCDLACCYCWVRRPRTHPGETGAFRSPEDAASRIIAIARENGFSQARLSGCEPTIGFAHLVALLGRLEGSGLGFVLETNGTLLGGDEARALARFRGFLHVRVSLKADTPERFAALTGAGPEAFGLPFEALRALVAEGVSCHAAIVEDVCTPEGLGEVERRLASIEPGLAEGLERERLIRYPFVERALAAPSVRGALEGTPAGGWAQEGRPKQERGR
jgi:uncharacterized Fe-S cluster-containing radical SAM superfamily protein